ncbi:hypothetical protein MASR2M78_33160 [Treponema sp.]
MTIDQEDALYDFLDNELEPFASSDLAAAIRQADSNGGRRLNEEAEAFLKSRKLAFPGDEGYWVSRRALFSARLLQYLAQQA